jgi:exonuclease VII small subunit
LSAQKYNLLNKFYRGIERLKKRCRDFIENRESQIEKSRKVEMTTS